MAVEEQFDVVTGAFGYTGKYVTERLLSIGRNVRTLTGRPDRASPFGSQVPALPFHFDQPHQLTEQLRGAVTLYNTYWVRFCHRGVTFERAVENTKTLVKAAKDAGVRRLVHVSITNASADSPLPYFRGKGILESAIRRSGISHAIVRPSLVFGREDILINNIAWFLRKLPVFGVPGAGRYRVQPVFVGDLAEIMVCAGGSDGDAVIDAVGPETFSFARLVERIASNVKSRAKIIRVPAGLALAVTRLSGWFVRDVVLTRGELDGHMAGLLVSDGPPTGTTRLSEWLAENAKDLGSRYNSELQRHYRR